MMTRSIVLTLAMVINSLVQAEETFTPPEVTTILKDLTVSSTQKTPQQSPIDTANGVIYIANVEPGLSGDTDGFDLHTVVRKGVKAANNEWEWTSHLIEDRTIADAWHTVPSVAVDKNGYIHVAYNMHNLPWQYKVSLEPTSIDAFEFLGDKISDEQIAILANENRTKYPNIGKAAIGGNQVTYPAFFRDNNRDLYVTYRYAVKPALKFKDRAMSSGIAKYNADAKTWSNIGVKPELEETDYKKKLLDWFSEPNIPEVFAMGDNWTSYHPRLTFGPNNSLNVSWMWREGIAGSEIVRPCFLTSKDHIEFRNSTGKVVALPATPNDCSNILGVSNTEEFYSIGNAAVNSKGEPHLILSPVRGSRKLVSFKNGQWNWQDSPYGATEIFFDADDNLWALASGLSILVREPDSDEWLKVLIADEKTECRPRASLNEEKTIAFIYSPNCDNNTISIKQLPLELTFLTTN